MCTYVRACVHVCESISFSYWPVSYIYIGGIVGLVLCLFAKFAARKNRKREQKQGY